MTSAHPSARYYTSRGNRSRWEDWDPENRIWFATEAALRAAYPDRTREDPTPSPTPKPPATATRTPSPTAAATRPPEPSAAPTVTPRPLATVPAGGILSPDPAGEWVTSTWSTTDYYTTREKTSVWKDWSEERRIWFATEAALLAAYPLRTKK